MNRGHGRSVPARVNLVDEPVDDRARFCDTRRGDNGREPVAVWQELPGSDGPSWDESAAGCQKSCVQGRARRLTLGLPSAQAMKA